MNPRLPGVSRSFLDKEVVSMLDNLGIGALVVPCEVISTCKSENQKKADYRRQYILYRLLR